MKKALHIGMLFAALTTMVTGCIHISAMEKQRQENPALPAWSSGISSPPSFAPLTGIRTGQEIRYRPIMVMVENSPKARPQTGLDQADLVYEVLAEGDITRFAAVFHSRLPETVGPVRSIRPYFVEIGDGLDAWMVHAGWSQEAMNIMAERNLAHFDQVYGDSAYYWRSGDRKPPHNLYTSLSLIRDGASRKKLRQEWNGQGFHFAKEGSSLRSLFHGGSGDRPAKRVSISYLNGYAVEYEYVPSSGMYNRYMAGAPHLDASSRSQLSAANILICESEHKIVDREGRRSVDVFGPGQGTLIQRGTARSVVWERKGGMIRAYIDEAEQTMLPGQTWVQLVPKDSPVSVTP